MLLFCACSPAVGGKFEKTTQSLLQDENTDAKKRDNLIAKCEEEMSKDPQSTGYCYFTMGRLYSNYMYNRDLRDYSKSLDYYQKALKAYAETPTPDSLSKATLERIRGNVLYNIGLLYYKNGELQNFDSALYYYEAASECDEKYYTGVAEMYLHGVGVEVNPDYALQCYKMALHGGSDVISALYAMDYYLEKLSKDELDTVAYRDYQAAWLMLSMGDGKAIKNHPDEIAEHQRLLRQAAERGYDPASFELGQAWMNAYYTKYTDKEAVKNAEIWLDKAMGNGYIPAVYSKGYLLEYFTHGGKLSNESLGSYALPLYQIAANAGHPLAQVAVGLCAFYGIGRDQNYEDARYWYNLAADQGTERAKSLLKSFEGERARMETSKAIQAIQDAADNLNLLLSTTASICDSREKMTETRNRKMQRTGYSQRKGRGTAAAGKSNDSGRKSDKKKKAAPYDNNWRTATKVYDDYCSMLSRMCYGKEPVNQNSRIECQRNMRQIREQYEAKGCRMYKSPWEDWDGKRK